MQESPDQCSFSPMRTGYCHNNALWMARFSKLSYIKRARKSGAPDAQKILGKLQRLDSGFQGVVPFNKKSSQAILIEHSDYFVAAFRGTDELGDWWDNLNVGLTSGPFGSVHRGFQNAMMDVWPAMRARLRELRDDKNPRPLWLTGHSLGGAMATLAAAQLIDHAQPFNGVYTFGQPRCGDRDFAWVFNSEAKERFFRFHNNNDIVTRVPARFMGYRHVGNYIYISEEGEFMPDISWWNRFVDRVRGAAQDIGEKGIDGVKDHRMRKYLKKIKKWPVSKADI